MDEASYESGTPILVLVPLNGAARKATENVLNGYYQYLDSEQFPTGLWINLSDPSKPTCTLGRAHTDIHLPDAKTSKGSASISDLHASFEFIPETGAVLLWDHSGNASVEPFTPNHVSGHSWTVKFRSHTRRSVVVARGINSYVAFGKDKWYQFEIQWHSEAMYGFNKEHPYILGPAQSSPKRYVELEKLGGGAYGTVYSAMDTTTGLLIAIKRFHSLSGKYLTFATREVANLRKKELRQHPHILRILDSAGGGEKEDWGEIFMPLQRGSLKDLLGEMETEARRWELSNVVLRQMLLALECLEANRIVHRDVKPDNILWDLDEHGLYTFCLGDFGLSNDPKVATTTAGTAPFMAPEVFYRQRQTTKIDIWSLYATIVWMRDGPFRATCSSLSAHELHTHLTETSKLAEYSNVRRMAAWHPTQRPSPSQQLHILDNGDYDDLDERGGYAPADPVDPEDDLANQFSSSMSLSGTSTNPALSYGGSGSSDYPAGPNSPEVAYYEPYAPQYPYSAGGGRGHHGKSSAGNYEPLPMGSSDGPREPGSPLRDAWVAPYGNAYTPLDSQATAVPDGMVTAIPVGDNASYTTLVDQGGQPGSSSQAYFDEGQGGYPEYDEYLEERRRLKGKNRSCM